LQIIVNLLPNLFYDHKDCTFLVKVLHKKVCKNTKYSIHKILK